jgi:hypothetical protein
MFSCVPTQVDYCVRERITLLSNGRSAKFPKPTAPWEMSRMFGDAPPRPWVIQTLVQAWQAINRRYPKGR